MGKHKSSPQSLTELCCLLSEGCCLSKVSAVAVISQMRRKTQKQGFRQQEGGRLSYLLQKFQLMFGWGTINAFSAFDGTSYINILSTNGAAASFILYPWPPGLQVCTRLGTSERCRLHPALAPMLDTWAEAEHGWKAPKKWNSSAEREMGWGCESTFQMAPQQLFMASLNQPRHHTSKICSVPLWTA